MRDKKLFLVTQKPKAKYAGMLRTLVAVVEATSVPAALRATEWEKDQDYYCKAVAQPLQTGTAYYI